MDSKTLFPMYVGDIKNIGHWVLLVFDHGEGNFYFYNSIQHGAMQNDVYFNNKDVKNMVQYLTNFVNEQNVKAGNDTKTEIKYVRAIPTQKNRVDCGVYICHYIKEILINEGNSFDKCINLTQFQIPDFNPNDMRVMIVEELLNQRTSWSLEDFTMIRDQCIENNVSFGLED